MGCLRGRHGFLRYGMHHKGWQGLVSGGKQRSGRGATELQGSHTVGVRAIMTNYQEISFTVRHRLKLTLGRVGLFRHHHIRATRRTSLHR